MAGLTVGLTLAGLSAIAASGYAYAEAQAKNPEGDVVYLSDGAKIRAGATVKLRPEAAAKYPGKGLTKPGSNFTGMVQLIDRTKGYPLIQVTNTVRTARLTDLYDPDDFTLIRPADETGINVAINGGVASVGTRVRYRKPDTSTNSSPKSLANPFYNSVGTVESVDPRTKLVTVKAIALKDSSITYTQEYHARELVFVSLPYNDDVRGIPTDYGFINVGSRVTLKQEKVMEFQKESSQLGKIPVAIPGTSSKIKLPLTVDKASSQKFLATPSVFEKVGVVTALMFDNDGKHKAVVKCKHLNSTHYYDQEYNVEDLQVVGSDGVPIGTVFILGGIAESGVEVKLRDEKKDEAPGKCLSRPTYGHKGTVEDVDPTAGDNLKVQVRCVGSNDGEEGSDWYEPEQLELLEMPKDQGIAIFGGFAIVGTVVEVMVDALGVKCLGKPSVGNVGVVMGIDPNGSNGETLNIKCGRDLRTNTKATNWYKPTDVKIYVKPDMSGSEQEIKEIKLIKKRSELLKEQTKRVITIEERDAKATNITRITAEIKTLEGEIEAEKKKGMTLEGMRDLYNRLMEDLVKFRRTTAGIDEEYNTAKLKTTCNISDVSTESILREEAEGIIKKYYSEATINTIIPAAGVPDYVSDEPSNDPAELKRLEDTAKRAIDTYNKDKTDPNKTAADDAVEDLKEFKEGRTYQAPQTDSQKNYIKKRDEFIKALGDIGPLERNFRWRGTEFNNIPGANILRVTGTNLTERYKRYILLVLRVELAKNTHPDDPIEYLHNLQPVTSQPFGVADLVKFVNVASSLLAVVQAATSTSPAVQAAGENLSTAAAAAGLLPTPENKAKCRLAAYDLLVAVVENSNQQTIANRFLTKLYWEKLYKKYSRNDYSIEDDRSFDRLDIILRKLNEARDKFDDSLNANTPEALKFRTLKKAFEDFDFARQKIFDEVHGETTDLEQRIKIMTEFNKQQTLKLHKLNNEMMAAQKEYEEQVKREKFADFLVMNALVKRKQEVDKYLNVSTPNPNPNPGGPPQQGGPAFGKRKKRGGAISSAEKEFNDYFARIFTNYIRINHYKDVILNNGSLSLASVLGEDSGKAASKLLYTQMTTMLKQIFANTSTNNYLYRVVVLSNGQRRAIADAEAARAQQLRNLLAEKDRLMGLINPIFTDADTINAQIDNLKTDAETGKNYADNLAKTSTDLFRRASAYIPALTPAILQPVLDANAAVTRQATIVDQNKRDVDTRIYQAELLYARLGGIKKIVTNLPTEDRQLAYSVKLLGIYLNNEVRLKYADLQQNQVDIQASVATLQRNIGDLTPLAQATQVAFDALPAAAAAPPPVAAAAAPPPPAVAAAAAPIAPPPPAVAAAAAPLPGTRQQRQAIARTSAVAVRDAVVAEPIANMVNAATAAGAAATAAAGAAGNIAGATIGAADAEAISDNAVQQMIAETRAAVGASGATPRIVAKALNRKIGQIVNAQRGGGYTIRRPVFSQRSTRRVSRY